MHGLTDQEDWDTAMGKGGALEALIEARDKGLTRFIGVTGHGFKAPKMHMQSLERFDFASVLLPLNYPLIKLKQYATDFELLKAQCDEKQVAVQTIKAVARGPWGKKEKNRTTWYEPLEHQDDVDRAVAWVLNHDSVFLNTASDTNVLRKILQAASDMAQKPTNTSMQAMASNRTMALIFEE